MSKPPRLSAKIKREMQRKAAEEFFGRLRHPATQIRPLLEEYSEPTSLQVTPTDLPPAGTVLGIEDSRTLLARLASGEIKQVRRR
jgi:hypothetical protein